MLQALRTLRVCFVLLALVRAAVHSCTDRWGGGSRVCVDLDCEAEGQRGTVRTELRCNNVLLPKRVPQAGLTEPCTDSDLVHDMSTRTGPLTGATGAPGPGGPRWDLGVT